MNLWIIHDGDKKVRGKIRKEINVSACYYTQVLKDEFIEICGSIQFDHILITVKGDSAIKAVTQRLKMLHVPDSKILVYKDYERNVNDKSFLKLDHFLHGRDQYEGLILGMSHTNEGIQEQCFKDKLLKLGVASIDLYYMKKLVEMLAESRKLSYCSYIIIELPYYIFNWDISKANKAYERFSLLHYFNDYHHFGETETSRRYINKMHVMQNIMEEKILAYSPCQEREKLTSLGKKKTKPYAGLILNAIKAFYHCVILESKEQQLKKRQACERDYGMWGKKYDITIKENKKIWMEMIELIINETKCAEIFVTVFPHNPYFIKCHKASIKKMKNIFYKIVGTDERITIIDHFKCFPRQKAYFEDECHLNQFGAYVYSGLLRRRLKFERSGCRYLGKDISRRSHKSVV